VLVDLKPSGRHYMEHFHWAGGVPRLVHELVDLLDLDARFESGAEVTLEALNGKNLATRRGIPVKVLAKGEITKPLTVHAHAFSAAARERIEAAGGTCQIIE